MIDVGSRFWHSLHLRVVLVTLPWVMIALSMCAGCGRKEAGVKNPMQSTERIVLPELTIDDLRADPNLIHERIRATNPAYQGGALVSLDPQVGLAGQINLKTVTDLSGLKGIPFRVLDLRGTPVSDLGPLQGMPLIMLGIEQTRVVDLGPIQDAELVKLYLNDTRVSDLGPLEGMPIEELMLVNTGVSELAALRRMPLKMLWLNNSPVSDIEPIAGCPLISLTLEGTRVVDLSPLSGNATLRRLHIGGTGVTDLSPLKDLQLERLIFAPAKITMGLDVVRQMTSLNEIGTTLEGRIQPAKFWELHGRRK